LYERAHFSSLNIVTVKELSDVHLNSEYCKIMQIPHEVEEKIKTLAEIIPKEFTHDTEQHFKFFYDKGHYLS